MKASPFLFVSAFLVACAPAPEKQPNTYAYSGRILHGDGSPAAGIDVVLRYSTSCWFTCNEGATKTTTDRDGRYEIREIGFLDKNARISVENSNAAIVEARFFPSQRDVKFPDLHIWDANLTSSFGGSEAEPSISMDWNPFPDRTMVREEQERWRAVTIEEPVLWGERGPHPLWEWFRNVDLPTRILQGFNGYWIDVTAQTSFETEGVEFTIWWNGGKLTTLPDLGDNQEPVASYLCGVRNNLGLDDNTTFSDELSDHKNAPLLILGEAIVCNFRAPTTASTFAWYGASAFDANTNPVGSDFNVWTFTAVELPKVSEWGAPVAEGEGMYDFVVLPAATSIRWIVMAPRVRDVLIGGLTEVKIW